MEEGAVPSHPGADPSAPVLGCLLAADRFNDPKLDPAALVTDALVKEVAQAAEGTPSCSCWRNQSTCRHASLSAAEAKAAFPCAAVLGEPLSDQTLMVVVDAELRSQLQGGRRPSFQNLVRGTVRMWPYKVHTLNLTPFASGLYDWTMSYDPAFLGYMQGVIERGIVEQDGGFIL
jgi:hypothetical protein